MNKYVLKVDEAGRVIIPKKVRIKYGINSNDTLLLTACDNGFSVKNDDCLLKYDKFFKKVNFISDKYNLSIFVSDMSHVIYSKGKIEFSSKKINKKIRNLVIFNKKGYDNDTIKKSLGIDFNCYYIYVFLDEYTRGILFINTSSVQSSIVNLLSILFS